MYAVKKEVAETFAAWSIANEVKTHWYVPAKDAVNHVLAPLYSASVSYVSLVKVVSCAVTQVAMVCVDQGAA